MKIKVLVYPRDANPYQNLLYSAISSHGIFSEYLSQDSSSATINLISIYISLLNYKFRGYNIFHLHWVNFSFPFNNVFFNYLSFFNTLFSLYWIKLLGFKIVWTMHNVYPHEKQTANDSLLVKVLINISDKIILHSKYVVNDLEKFSSVKKRNKIIIIPHGLYSYPNTADKEQARKLLNIDSSQFVFLFFGKLRAYKGIEKLVEAFLKISHENKKCILVIVGKIYEKNLENYLKNIPNERKERIRLFLGHIPDIDIQNYFQASNVCVLPFRTITTSGSALLALSFEKPLISPLLGNVRDLPLNTGFYYDPADDNGLEMAMSKAMNEKYNLSEYSTAIKEFNRKLSWKSIAEQTIRAYQDALSN